MIIETEYVPILIAFSAFLSMFLLVVWMYYYGRQRAQNRAMIERIQGGGSVAGSKTPPPFPGKYQQRVADILGRLGQRVGPEKSGDLPNLRLRFLKAGFRKKNAPSVFWGVKCLLMMALPVSFLLIRATTLKLLTPSMTLMGCVLLALVGFYAPEAWLRFKTARRKERIFRALPDALDLLVVCVEAGMGLDAALSRVAEEMRWSSQELSDEIKLLNLELRAGKARQDALRNLALRVDIEDLRNLVTLLVQTDKFGTSVADALRVYSDSLRTRRFQMAEEVAVKLPTKLIFPLILFIFPSLFVAILGPAAINLYRLLLSR
jgi:tight adherence protein C